MSDGRHLATFAADADTIRRYLEMSPPERARAEQEAHKAGAAFPQPAALAALDALVAHRDELRDEAIGLKKNVIGRLAEPVWKIAYLHFTDTATIEDVNAEVAKHPGWEPFATRPHPDGGWWLLLKRKADEDRRDDA